MKCSEISVTGSWGHYVRIDHLSWQTNTQPSPCGFANKFLTVLFIHTFTTDVLFGLDFYCFLSMCQFYVLVLCSVFMLPQIYARIHKRRIIFLSKCTSCWFYLTSDPSPANASNQLAVIDASYNPPRSLIHIQVLNIVRRDLCVNACSCPWM